MKESSEQEELFGELLGFKAGDRVKTRQNRFWEDGWYWKYLVVEAVEVRKDYITGTEVIYYRVHERGDLSFSYLLEGRHLVRCRQYVKKKPWILRKNRAK